LPVDFELEAGEALPIISGGTVTAAFYLDAARRAAALADLAEGALALFMEATRAEASSLDARTHVERNIPEQNEVASRLRMLTKGSGWMTDEGRMRLDETDPRIQDALSVRTAPHVFGSLRHDLVEAYTIFQREANASTSNPLVFPRKDGLGYEFVMGGNWSSAVMGHAADSLNAILADVAVLSQELSARLLCEKWSYGLPASLTGGKPGLNSGMTHVQTIATALIPEIQVRAAPSATLSRPAKFAQEDHNTMAMASVRNLHENLDRVETVIAVQLLMSAQGIDLIQAKMHGLQLGSGTKRLHDVIRQSIPALAEDRYMTPEVNKIVELVRDGTLLSAIRDTETIAATGESLKPARRPRSSKLAQKH
jgi:histidine ammonia-lyase